MNESQAAKVKSTCNIPPDLLTAEILTRLPAKSLVRFKCVSKPWLSTISSPNFVNLYFEKSISKPLNHGVLIKTKSSLYALPNYPSYDYGSENFDLDQVKVKLDHHGITGSFKLLGTCNGLVCFKLKSGDLRVWNPFIRECREVPRPQNVNYLMFEPSLLTFGYIPCLDDYKIMDIVNHVYMSAPKRYGTMVRVYSFSSSNWSEVETSGMFEGFNYGNPVNFATLLPNGKSHWLLSEFDFIRQEVSNLMILVCDLVTEAFDEIALPNDLSGDGMKDCACIGSIEEDLFIASQGSDHCLQVWVLESYRDSGSWKKFLKLSGVPSPFSGEIKFCTLCRIGKGGKFLMEITGEVWVLYWSDDSPQNVRIEALGIRSIHGHRTHHMSLFDGTLVSPFLTK